MKRTRTDDEDASWLLYASWHARGPVGELPELPNEMWLLIVGNDLPLTLRVATTCSHLYTLFKDELRRRFLRVWEPYIGALRARDWDVFDRAQHMALIAAKMAFRTFLDTTGPYYNYFVRANFHGACELTLDETLVVLAEAGEDPFVAKKTAWIVDHGPHTFASLYLIPGRGGWTSTLARALVRRCGDDDPVLKLAFMMLPAPHLWDYYYNCSRESAGVLNGLVVECLLGRVSPPVLFSGGRHAHLLEYFFFGECPDKHYSLHPHVKDGARLSALDSPVIVS